MILILVLRTGTELKLFNHFGTRTRTELKIFLTLELEPEQN